MVVYGYKPDTLVAVATLWLHYGTFFTMRKNDPDVGEIGRNLLPVLSNQKCNEYLKEIAQLAQQLGVAL